MAEQTLRRHWWVAALLGLLVTGLGQLYVGQFRLALAFAVLWLAGSLFLASDLLLTFGGFVAVFGSVLALHLVAVGLAATRAWRQPGVARAWMHRWYVYPLYAVALVTVSVVLDFAAHSAFGIVPWMERYRPSRIASASMEPTLLSGDYFIAERVSHDFPARVDRQVGDIVLYSSPDLSGTYVHRLVAVGGDEIGVHEGNLVVNGQAVPRTPMCTGPKRSPTDSFIIELSAEEIRGRQYAVQHMSVADPYGPTREREAETVPAGSFFVVGDSRDNSNDSRFHGPLRDEAFAGRALYIIWSNDWSRIGRSLVAQARVNRADYCGAAAP